MSILRTPDIEVGKDFEAFAEITKATVDSVTGKRRIIGVATGVAEDRDGERVSKNAIIGMGRKIQQGGVKVTSSHQQDWMTEIGDVVKYTHDADTDEMIIEAMLPPEGVDPIADKAWRVANTERVGWSIGGKLLKSYFERNELGKKRKVLDAIDLRHVLLTKHPSYAQSFAEAVAKSFDGEPPADDEFTIEVDESIEKSTTTGSFVSGDSDSGGGNVGRDSVGSGQRNAGSKDPKSKGMSTEEDGSNNDDDDDDKLPKVKDERHLACPNCGHEFAADLPLDPEERQVDETGDDNEPDNEDEKPQTGKSATKEDLMSKLDDTLDAIKTLVASEVSKTETEPTEPVEKTVTPDGPTDVEKMLAASHRAHEDRFASVEKGISDGFELVAKAIKDIREEIGQLPLGRRSVARILPPAVGHDANGGSVEKSTEEQIEEAPDAVTALKIANKARYGVE